MGDLVIPMLTSLSFLLFCFFFFSSRILSTLGVRRWNSPILLYAARLRGFYRPAEIASLPIGSHLLRALARGYQKKWGRLGLSAA